MSIHPTAIIDRQAQIAPTADIGPYVNIEGAVKIGEHVKVYPNAYLSGWTEIGDRCQIHPNAIVGHLPQDFHYKGERSYCKIGAGTIIRECASIHRGTQPESTTVVGENCFILAYSHIGHNCELGNNVKLYNCAALAGHVTVGDNTIISGYGMIHQFARIGEFVMIGACTLVSKDIPPYMKAWYQSQIVGYNAIGLKRSGQFTPAEVLEARNAYKAIFRSERPLNSAIEEFAPTAKERTGRRIVEFVRAPSRLGCASGLPSGRGQADRPAVAESGDED